MAFILVTLFLDVLGFGIIIPVLPGLVTKLSGGDASSGAANFGLITSAFAAMQFLFSPALGALSDRVGRRPVLLIALTGLGLSYLLMAYAPSVGWLLTARVLAGITGASFTTANAYIADVSTPTTRAQNFGMVGAAFGLGFICGPALGGVLGRLGHQVPFLVSAGVALLNVLYGFLVLPESLPREKRRAFVWKEANPVGGVLAIRRYPVVAGMAVVFVLVSLAQRGMETVWVLYTTYRYRWTELENGLALALLGVTAVVVQGVLIRRIIPRLGERRAVLAGLSISAVSMVMYGLASSGWMMLVVVVVAALGGIAGPAIQGIVSGSVSPSEQGMVQGIMTSIMSLTAIVAPLTASQVFSYFTSPRAPVLLPGAPFFAGAVFSVLGLLMAFRFFRRDTGAGSPTTVPGSAVTSSVVG
jgi:DHA1 family tetracycline resistance protein-like MFS transporter